MLEHLGVFRGHQSMGPWGLIAVLSLVLFIYLGVRDFLLRKKINAPGPCYYIPIFGPALTMVLIGISQVRRGYDFITDLNYGQTWGIQPIGKPTVIISSDPAVCDYILRTNFNNYIKGPYLTEGLFDVFGNGIFNINGGEWKRQRQIASHMFKIKEMKHYADVFNDHGTKLLQKLESFKTSGKSVDIQDIISKFTLDSIGEVAFGYNIDSLNIEDHTLGKSFNEVQTLISERFRNPLIAWLGFTASKKIIPSEKRLAKHINVVNQFVYDMVKDRMKVSEEELQSKTDLLSRYVIARDFDGSKFSEDYLKDIVVNFLVAGRDTTAITLTCTFLLLAQNPRVEKKLVEEIEEALHGEYPTYEKVKNMPYLTAVIDETLRIYPPVPIDPKQAVDDDILPNGIFVPKGSLVSWCAWGMGRNEELWDNAYEFRPERWHGQNGGKEISSTSFIPFQSGPRTCLGMQMAYLETKMILIRVLQKYRFILDDSHKIKFLTGITLFSNGVKMFVESA